MVEPLFFIDPKTGGLNGWLAESAEFTDSTTILIELRRGVRWTDGRPFTARDVELSILIALENEALDGPHVAAVREKVESVRQVERYVVELRLKRPDPAFLHLHFAAHDGMSFPIIPAQIWNWVEDPLTFENLDPIGTGPYKLDDPQADDGQVSWTRASWWGERTGWRPAPAPRHLIWVPPLGIETRLQVLSRGGIDAGGVLPASIAGSLESAVRTTGFWKSGGASLRPDICGYDAFLNADIPALKTPEGRNALFLLLDRGRLARRIVAGAWLPAASFVPNHHSMSAIRAALDTLKGSLPSAPDADTAIEGLGALGCTFQPAAGSKSNIPHGAERSLHSMPGTLMCPLTEGGEPSHFAVPIIFAEDDPTAEMIARETRSTLRRLGLVSDLTALAPEAIDDHISDLSPGLILRERRCHDTTDPLAALSSFLTGPAALEGDLARDIAERIERFRESSSSEEIAQAFLDAGHGYRGTPILDRREAVAFSEAHWTGWPEGDPEHGTWSQRGHLIIHGLRAAD